jgi:hypothetical protein
MGIVSPATAASMAPRYMAPASFATGTPSADATRYSYDPNPSGTNRPIWTGPRGQRGRKLSSSFRRGHPSRLPSQPSRRRRSS